MGEQQTSAEVRPAASTEDHVNPVYDRERRFRGGYYWGTGRRKKAVARVRIKPGAGKIVVNNRVYTDYFPLVRQREEVLAPLKLTNTLGKIDIFCNVGGGGVNGQASAVKLGIARAISVMDARQHPVLRDAGHLTRDPRMPERKKYGRRGARRGFQFSKR